MTPDAIDRAMPTLITSAAEQIDRLSLEEPVMMEKVATAFTLDVAWRQILGLDLREDKVETFDRKTYDWIGGIINPLRAFYPARLSKHTKSHKALAYLVTKIDRKIESLERNGPDGSTMSGMLFAKDEEDPSKSLSRDEIVSNTLLLILAGSETAASTLTVATLALGLHKDVFRKLKEEQQAKIEKHGEGMTRGALEDCTYLDAVIKETMRIKPLASTGAMRDPRRGGRQIPKGYGIAFNPTITHALDPAVEEEDGSHMDVVRGFKPE
ncbi:hypothetical protein ACHAWF_001152 [Thalassiosira exigua]